MSCSLQLLVTYLINRHATQKFVTDIDHLHIGIYWHTFSTASYGTYGMNWLDKGNGYVMDSLKDHKKAAIKTLDMKPEYMLDWQNQELLSGNSEPSFFICYDEHTKSIVISFRELGYLFTIMIDKF